MNEKIQEWVGLALKNEDLVEYEVNTQGKGNKDDGYLGNIFFVRVSGKTKKGQTKSLNLVIKASKESETLRRQTPIKEAFEKEIFIYTEVLTAFDKFQKEVAIEDLLDVLPKCYTTQICQKGELLVFENLKSLGYNTWDRKSPMTYEHVKLVMEAYGRWHAFSFALRKKRRHVFEKLCKNNVNMFSHFILTADLEEVFLENYVKSLDMCIGSEEKDFLHTLRLNEKDANYNFTGLFSEEPEYHVISHGDCWNNNFMFKTDNNAKPTSVRILDWQCSGLSSPVMDLSHFIYGCCDTGKYTNISDFLKIYHKSFSKCLKKLNCDAEKLFPYIKLLEHWRKFSRYGIFLHAFVLKFSMCEAEEAPDLAEAAEAGKTFRDNFTVKISNEDGYYERSRNNLVHYVNNLTICVE